MEDQHIIDDLSSRQGNQVVPYSTSVLVLGILSITLCWCAGIVGTTLGIIALVQASRGTQAYLEAPSAYREGSYSNLKAGKVCAIIGLSLSGLYLLYFIFNLILFGAAISSMPWQHMMNK
jgi:hypothetical protein